MRERVISDPMTFGTGALSEASRYRILQSFTHDEEGGQDCTLLQKIEKLIRGSRPGTIIERVRETLHESSLHRFELLLNRFSKVAPKVQRARLRRHPPSP
jgi:hypothetical protein